MSDTIKSVSENWPVIFRGVMYFSIGFLAPMIDQISEFLKADHYPSIPRLILGTLVGLLAGLTALRAFYDGSAQRHSDEKKNGNSDTQFLTKPKTQPTPS